MTFGPVVIWVIVYALSAGARLPDSPSFATVDKCFEALPEFARRHRVNVTCRAEVVFELRMQFDDN